MRTMRHEGYHGYSVVPPCRTYLKPITPRWVRLKNPVMAGLAAIAVTPFVILWGLVEMLRLTRSSLWLALPVLVVISPLAVVSIPWVLVWAAIAFFVRETFETLEKRHAKRIDSTHRRPTHWASLQRKRTRNG